MRLTRFRCMTVFCLTVLSVSPLVAQSRVSTIDAAEELARRTGRPILALAGRGT